MLEWSYRLYRPDEQRDRGPSAPQVRLSVILESPNHKLNVAVRTRHSTSDVRKANIQDFQFRTEEGRQFTTIEVVT